MVKKKDHKDLKENSSYLGNLFHTAIFFSISMLVIFLYLILPDIFINNTTQSIRFAVLVILLIGFLILFVFISFASSFKKEFCKNFILMVILLGLFYALFTFSLPKIVVSIIQIALVSTVLIYPYFLEIKWSGAKLRAALTVILMLYTFFFGIVMINEVYGYKPVSAYLNVNGNVDDRYYINEDGNLICSSFREKIFVGMNVSCVIDPPLKEIVNTKLIVTDQLGYKKEINITEDLEFMAPENLYEMHFQINGINSSDDEINVSTSWQYTFHTLSRFEKRQEEFTKYFLGLLGLVFITIPLMVNQFKELLRD